MKNRPARVRELIQRELGAVVAHEMNFTTLVTVQAVDLTADFKHCHVHIGVLGSEREQKDVIHALAERRPYLQHELSKRVILKYTPRLHFHLDHSVERGTKITEIMRQIDEITPPEETPGDDALHPRAAKEAVDMEAQDVAEQQREIEEAARREVETDGADEAQDETFEDLALPTQSDETPAKGKEERQDRPARGSQNRAALQGEEADE